MEQTGKCESERLSGRKKTLGTALEENIVHDGERERQKRKRILEHLTQGKCIHYLTAAFSPVTKMRSNFCGIDWVPKFKL